MKIPSKPIGVSPTILEPIFEKVDESIRFILFSHLRLDDSCDTSA
jgi:hypothetical protein